MSVSPKELSSTELLRYDKRLRMQLWDVELPDVNALYRKKNGHTIADWTVLISNCTRIIARIEAVLDVEHRKGMESDMRYVAFLMRSRRSYLDLRNWAKSRLDVMIEVQKMRETYSQMQTDPHILIGGSDV